MATELIASHVKNLTPDGENALLKILRTEAVKQYKAQNGEKKIEGEKEADTTPSLHEIIYDLFDEFSSVAVAKAFWKRLLMISGEPTLLAAVSSMLGSIVLDVLVVLEIEAADYEREARLKWLHELVQVGIKDSLVKQSDIVSRFSIGSAASILKVSEAQLSQKYRLSISRYFFTLSEHNLLREESEGYSKLIALLMNTQFITSPSQHFTSTITKLIGSFSLHPNRVLDIVLAAAGYHLDKYFEDFAHPRSINTFSRSIASIRDYLASAPRSHLYSLLSFHLRQTTPAKPTPTAPTTTEAKAETRPASNASAAPKKATTEQEEEEELLDPIALTTCRILAMMVHYKLFLLNDIMSLLLPPADPSEAQPQAEDSTDKPSATMMEVDCEPAEPEISADHRFLRGPKLPLLLALLEIPVEPGCKPLGFLSDDSDICTLFNDVLHASIFANRRVANIISERLVSHFYPVFQPLSPSNFLLGVLHPEANGTDANSSSSPKVLAIPSMQEFTQSFLEAKDLLRLMGENLSAPIHHIVCTIASCLLEGIQHSSHALRLLSTSSVASNLTSSNGMDIDLSSSGAVKNPRKVSGNSTPLLVPSNVDEVSSEMLSNVFNCIEDILTNTLLPSFVCLQINGASLWQLLQKFDYVFRFRVYHAWGRMMKHTSFPQLTRIGSEARLKVRGMMKRMTDSSIKETGRPLCKSGNSFPIILSDLIGNLVFNNFVQPLAENMRYLSDISMDVLIYACLDAAVNMPPSAYSHLANVATFITTVYKLYYERLDIVPLLDAIEQLLKRSNVAGATIFTSLLSKMGCVDILEETLSPQIKMLNSFPSLQTLVISGGALTSRETSRSSMAPLRDRLWSSNSWLPLYILVQQFEKQWVYNSESNDHAGIANTFDTIHQLSLQLADFVAHIFRKYSTQINPSLLMSAGKIAKAYDISFSSILHLYRPILHLIYKDVAELQGFEASSSTGLLLLSKDLSYTLEGRGRISMLYPLDAKLQAKLDSLMPPPDPNAEYYVHKTDLTPIENICVLSGQFIAAFWALRLKDVECNAQVYKEAMAKQSQVQQMGSRDRERNEKTDDISPTMIEKDLTAHTEHVAAVFERLKKNCATWFVPPVGENEAAFFGDMGELAHKKTIAMSVLQQCILPRVFQSAEDALYCGAFLKVLHRLNPTWWDTEVFMDLVIETLPLVFSSTTTNESSRFGRFFAAVVELIVSWRDFDAWSTDLCGREVTVPLNALPQQHISTDASSSSLDRSSSSGVKLESSTASAMDVDAPASEEDQQADSGSAVVKMEDDNGGASAAATTAEGESIQAKDSEAAAATPAATKVPEEGPSPMKVAHKVYCLRSLKWEQRILELTTEGISRPVDRWMRRALLFFLKELNTTFPSCERFCVILGHTLKTHTQGTDDLKALANSYLNILELRSRSCLPHKRFQALYPEYAFPAAPADSSASTRSMRAMDDSDAPPATPVSVPSAYTETKRASTPVRDSRPPSRAQGGGGGSGSGGDRTNKHSDSTTDTSSNTSGKQMRGRGEVTRGPTPSTGGTSSGRDREDGGSGPGYGRRTSEFRDSRDMRDRDPRDARDARDGRDGRDHRDGGSGSGGGGRDNRDSGRDSSRDYRDVVDAREYRPDSRNDNRGAPMGRDHRDHHRDHRDGRSDREGSSGGGGGREGPRGRGGSSAPLSTPSANGSSKATAGSTTSSSSTATSSSDSSGTHNDKKRPAPTADLPPAEKKQKTSETTATSRSVTPPPPTTSSSSYNSRGESQGSAPNSTKTSKDDVKPDQVIGPPLPPKHARRQRRNG